MQFTNRVLNQDVNFMRTVQDWELEFLSNFMDVIYGTSVTGGGYSVIPDEKKGFTMSGYY